MADGSDIRRSVQVSPGYRSKPWRSRSGFLRAVSVATNLSATAGAEFSVPALVSFSSVMIPTPPSSRSAPVRPRRPR